MSSRTKYVNSTVKLYPAKLKNLDAAETKALEQTAEALHTKSIQDQVFPRDSGTMQNEKTFVDYEGSSNGTVDIITEGPYARKMYYHPEYKFQKIENANAKGKWYSDYLPGGKHETYAKRMFAALYRRISKL